MVNGVGLREEKYTGLGVSQNCHIKRTQGVNLPGTKLGLSPIARAISQVEVGRGWSPRGRNRQGWTSQGGLAVENPNGGKGSAVVANWGRKRTELGE